MTDPASLDARPSFSPRGDRVLFKRSPAGDQATSSLWIVPAAGGSPAEPFLSRTSLQATCPDWT